MYLGWVLCTGPVLAGEAVGAANLGIGSLCFFRKEFPNLYSHLLWLSILEISLCWRFLFHRAIDRVVYCNFWWGQTHIHTLRPQDSLGSRE